MDPQKLQRLQAAFSELMSFAEEQGALPAPGQIQIEESATAVKLLFPASNWSKDQIQISMDENVLNLKLFKVSKDKEVIDPKKIDRVTKPVMTQSIPLPYRINANESFARLKDEVLEINLKKKAFVKKDPQVIEVRD